MQILAEDWLARVRGLRMIINPLNKLLMIILPQRLTWPL